MCTCGQESPARRRESRRVYATRWPERTDLYRLLLDYLETFFADYDRRLQPRHGYLRPEARRALEEFIRCGVIRFGLARMKCRDCGDEALVPLSCRRRGLCSSCHQKRRLVWAEWALEECLPEVSYRQWVFSLPKALRVYFRFDPELFKGLSRIVVNELTRYTREVTGHADLEPGFVVWDHTFGTLPDSYHPHPHVCATEGGYLPDGSFVPLPRVRRRDTEALCEVLRRRVIGWLLRKGKLSEELAGSLLSWEHSGFSLDATRRVAAGSRDRLEDLLLYMSRHPFVAGGIHYDAVSGTVHYQAFRKHKGRGTDAISAEAVEFIAMLAQHIPHARKHQVRYYGACTPEVRKRLGLSRVPPRLKIPARTAARGRRSWARLIWKVYGVDPQICPKCGGDREIISVILQDDVIVKILAHLGLPSRLPALKPARGPPIQPAVEPAARSRIPPQFEEGFFVDPDYSEFDYIDEPPEVDRQSSRIKDKDSRPPRGILELVDHYPGKKLCWATQLLEDEEKKE